MWQDNNEPGSTVNRLQWEEVFRYLCNQLCSSWTCTPGLLVVNLLNSGVLQITWSQMCWEVLRVSWPLCGYLRKCSLNKEKFGSTACVRNHGSDGLLGHVYLTNFISCQKFRFGSSVPWCAAVPSISMLICVLASLCSFWHSNTESNCNLRCYWKIYLSGCTTSAWQDV